MLIDRHRRREEEKVIPDFVEKYLKIHCHISVVQWEKEFSSICNLNNEEYNHLVIIHSLSPSVSIELFAISSLDCTLFLGSYQKYPKFLLYSMYYFLTGFYPCCPKWTSFRTIRLYTCPRITSSNTWREFKTHSYKTGMLTSVCWSDRLVKTKCMNSLSFIARLNAISLIQKWTFASY